MDKLTVVLADDHSIVREGIGRLVESFGNIEIIGHAVDGYEAVQLTAQLRPHIVILDISMPKLHGVEAVREIKQRSPETKVIMLSMHNKDRYIKDCMRNGASAYLLKESAVKENDDRMAVLRAEIGREEEMGMERGAGGFPVEIGNRVFEKLLFAGFADGRPPHPLAGGRDHPPGRQACRARPGRRAWHPPA